MRTRQGETIDWGYGFALPRLPSRPRGARSGGGMRAGFGLGVFGNSAAIFLKINLIQTGILSVHMLIVRFYLMGEKISEFSSPDTSSTAHAPLFIRASAWSTNKYLPGTSNLNSTILAPPGNTAVA